MNKITLPFELYHQMRIEIAQNTLNPPILAGKEAIEDVFSYADDFLSTGGYVCGDVASVGKPQFNGRKGWIVGGDESTEEPDITAYGTMPPPQELLDYIDTLGVKYKVVRPATSEDRRWQKHFYFSPLRKKWVFSEDHPCDTVDCKNYQAYIVEKVEEGGK